MPAVTAERAGRDCTLQTRSLTPSGHSGGIPASACPTGVSRFARPSGHAYCAVESGRVSRGFKQSGTNLATGHRPPLRGRRSSESEGSARTCRTWSSGAFVQFAPLQQQAIGRARRCRFRAWSACARLCRARRSLPSLGGFAALAIAANPASAQSADLVVNQADSPDPGPAGGVFTYTIRVDNNGPDAAVGVNFADTLPPGSTFVGVIDDAGNVQSARRGRRQLRARRARVSRQRDGHDPGDPAHARRLHQHGVGDVEHDRSQHVEQPQRHRGDDRAERDRHGAEPSSAPPRRSMPAPATPTC